MAIESRRDLISKRQQICHTQHAPLASRQVIVDDLKRIAREVLIDEICGLLRAQMRTGGPTVSQRFLVQCEERAIAVNTYDSPSTILTLGKMIA